MPSPSQSSQANRIELKMKLHEQVRVVASDLQIIEKPRKKKVFTLNPVAAKIVLEMVSTDANRGYRILMSMDLINLYGKLIVAAHNDFCKKDLNRFIELILAGDQSLLTFLRSVK